MLMIFTATICGSFQVTPAATVQAAYVRYLVESFAPHHCEVLEPFAIRPMERGDVTELRALWQARYKDLRDERVPDTLAKFSVRYPYKSWPLRIVSMSAAKDRPRHLYEHADVSVAETLDEGLVRETEVAIARRDGSGNFDFYVYDADGEIAEMSTFPAGARPSPTICAACHFDQAAGVSKRSPAR